MKGARYICTPLSLIQKQARFARRCLLLCPLRASCERTVNAPYEVSLRELQFSAIVSLFAQKLLGDTALRIKVVLYKPLLFVAIAMLASAYSCYAIACKGLEPAVGLAGFSLVAVITAVVLSPQDVAKWPTYVRTALSSWSGWLLVGISCISNAAYYSLLLACLDKTAPTYILTITLIQPILQVLIGVLGFGYRVERPLAFALWTALALGGLFLFKYSQLTGEAVALTAFDWMLIGVMVFDTGSWMVSYKITAEDENGTPHYASATFLTVLKGCFAFICAATAVTVFGQWPDVLSMSTTNIFGILYLGIVPTALAGISIIYLQDAKRLGYTYIHAMMSTKVIMSFLIALIINTLWPNTIASGEANIISYVGMFMGILGIMFAFRKGGVAPPDT